MTDACAAGLLRDVLENPGDDTPRLILADYWEDAGEVERAEFVRVQIRLTRESFRCTCGTPGECSGHPQCPATRLNALRVREAVLLHGWRDRWMAPLLNLLEWPEPCWRRFTWKRGFVGVVNCEEVDFLGAAGRGLFGVCPVTDVALAGKKPRQRPEEPPWWAWEAGHRHAYRVAPELFRLLADEVDGVFNPPTRWYPDEGVAYCDLSRAAVAYGRSAAGL